jgi:hypothetical protein
LPRCLASSIDIKNDAATPLSIEDATDGICSPPLRKALLLEESTKGFDTGAIYIGKIATQRGAMGKACASKECHEG